MQIAYLSLGVGRLALRAARVDQEQDHEARAPRQDRRAGRARGRGAGERGLGLHRPLRSSLSVSTHVLESLELSIVRIGYLKRTVVTENEMQASPELVARVASEIAALEPHYTPSEIWVRAASDDGGGFQSGSDFGQFRTHSSARPAARQHALDRTLAAQTPVY